MVALCVVRRLSLRRRAATFQPRPRVGPSPRVRARGRFLHCAGTRNPWKHPKRCAHKNEQRSPRVNPHWRKRAAARRPQNLAEAISGTPLRVLPRAAGTPLRVLPRVAFTGGAEFSDRRFAADRRPCPSAAQCAPTSRPRRSSTPSIGRDIGPTGSGSRWHAPCSSAGVRTPELNPDPGGDCERP